MRHILLDTDGGVDDALAVVLALASPDLAIEAITTVSGNVTIEPSTRNVFLVLERFHPAICPQVAQGAAGPLKEALVTAEHVHGVDGIGNIMSLKTADQRMKYPEPKGCPVSMHAAEMIVSEARRHGRDLSIVTMGPLTNVAMAIEMDPDAMRTLSEIIIMGGAFRVYGNTSPVAEFNIFVDPEAAARVIEFDVPKRIVPLDVTEQVRMMRSELHARIEYAAPVIAEFVRDVTAFYMDFHRENDGFDGCFMHDPTSVALAIRPDLARTVDAEVRVESSGQYTRGMTVADLRPERSHHYRPNSKVCVSIDAQACVDMFFEQVFRSDPRQPMKSSLTQQ